MKRVAAPKRERKNDFEIWRDAFERRVMKDTELLPQYRLVLLALAKFLNRKTRNARRALVSIGAQRLDRASTIGRPWKWRLP